MLLQNIFQELKLRKAKQLLVGTSLSVKKSLLCSTISLPSISSPRLRNVRGLLHWSIALMVGKPEERRYKTKKDLTSKS